MVWFSKCGPYAENLQAYLYTNKTKAVNSLMANCLSITEILQREHQTHYYIESETRA